MTSLSHSTKWAGWIIVLGIAIVVFYFFSASSKVFFSTKSMSSSQNQSSTICTPELQQAGKCPTLGAQLITEANFYELWRENMAVKAYGFPDQSWSHVVTSTEKDFELRLYPHLPPHDILKPYDITLVIQMHKTNRPAGPVSCLLPKGFEDLRDETFQTSSFDVTVRSLLHYSYRGPAGSNPNPYTPEIMDLLLSIWRSLRIGNCK